MLRFGNRAHFKKLDNKTVRYIDTASERKDKVKNIVEYFSIRKRKPGKIKSIASFLIQHTKNCWLMHQSFHYCSPTWCNTAPFGLTKINKKQLVDDSVFLSREDN